MRAEEIIYESRGVTARVPGEQYINDADPSDILTIQDINVIPDDIAAFESLEDLEAALDAIIPDQKNRVEDNAKNSGMRAAVIATVTDSNDQPQYWVRYLKAIPPGGVHSLWKTLRGYKFSKGAKDESLPIKPSDLITDETYRNTDQLANEVVSNMGSQLAGTGHEKLEAIMVEAVKQARNGSSSYIPGANEYTSVLQKYGGEYLGPLAFIDATNTVTGDTAEMLKHFGLSTLKGSTIMFPQDTAMELIDSIIEVPDGQQIQISSKISKAGGAASSLSGVYKQMSDDIRKKYPTGSKIIELLATESSVNGPLKVARMFNIIDQADIQAMAELDKGTQNIQDLNSDRLRQLTAAQGVAAGTLERSDYRVFYHALTAITVAMANEVNQYDEFAAAMTSALNNNQFVMLMTKGSKSGNDLALSYYTKFPAVFEGKPVLYNKSYFATGQKGRIGFKLK